VARSQTKTGAKPVRPELSAPLQNYVDLHRHAAVRTALLDHPGVTLRLMVAHVVCGSGLWSVRPDPQRVHTTAIEESLETCVSEAAFDEKRRAALGLIAADAEQPTVTRSAMQSELPQLFAQLMTLSDAEVLTVLAVAMGETLEAGSLIVDAIGEYLAVDMRPVWKPDDAFVDLLRDRRVVRAMLAEVGGSEAAMANASATLKVQKDIIRDCLRGDNGRPRVEGWLPAWLRFPRGGYLKPAED
jgi:ParB family chromosome partitioning protein